MQPIRNITTEPVRYRGDERQMVVLNPSQQALYTHVIELICFLVRVHTHRTKFPLLHDDLLQQVGLLFQAKSTGVKLCKFL